MPAHRERTIKDTLHESSRCWEEPLDGSALQAACADRIIGNKICILEQVPSTNEVALEWGERGEKEGAVVFAELQTAARGQFGRSWHSPGGGQGIWCSVLLRPTFAPRMVTFLTPLAVMAVASAIYRATGLKPQLKPPNDLYLSLGKTCGILTEVRTRGTEFFAVVGIGINVNQEEFPPALQGIATSLRKETGCCYHRTKVALAVLEELNTLYVC